MTIAHLLQLVRRLASRADAIKRGRLYPEVSQQRVKLLHFSERVLQLQLRML